MPVRELRCPRCGSDVKMGLPGAATVKSVTANGSLTPAEDEQKARSLVCPNGHEFQVLFEP